MYNQFQLGFIAIAIIGLLLLKIAYIDAETDVNSNEKVAPPPSEEHVKQEKHVQEAIVYLLFYINNITNVTIYSKFSNFFSQSSRHNTSQSMPLYILHSTNSSKYQESFAEITVRQPEYRTVKGTDPYTGKPLRYQTVVMVDKTITLMTGTSVDLDIAVKLNISQDTAINTDNNRIIHLIATVCTDQQGYKAVTQFRSHSDHIINNLNIFDNLAQNLLVNTFSSSESPVLSQQFVNEGNGTSFDVNDTVSVMSVNIWNYNYWEHRTVLLQSEIQRLNPDFIGFQEVRARKVSPLKQYRHQVQTLAELLPNYEYISIPAMGFREGDQEYVTEGLAIFSKKPIIHINPVLLSRDPLDTGDFHQRLLLDVVILLDHTENKTIHMMTTHLTLSDKARVRSITEIGEHGRTITNMHNTPFIVVGDFNSINDENIQRLSKEYDCIDIWVQLYGNTEPVSNVTETGEPSIDPGWTFNSWRMRSRIDYIFVNKLIEPTYISVEGKNYAEKHGLPGIAGVEDMKSMMFPSDHRFLYAKLKIHKADQTQQIKAKDNVQLEQHDEL